MSGKCQPELPEEEAKQIARCAPVDSTNTHTFAEFRCDIFFHRHNKPTERPKHSAKDRTFRVMHLALLLIRGSILLQYF